MNVNEARWGFLATITVICGLILAIVLYVAVPDQRWIAGVVAGFAIVDALLIGAVLPNMLGRRSTSWQIDALNEAADLADDEPRETPR